MFEKKRGGGRRIGYNIGLTFLTLPLSVSTHFSTPVNFYDVLPLVTNYSVSALSIESSSIGSSITSSTVGIDGSIVAFD